MNPNSNAIFTLCSHLCVGDGVFPLEPKEYSSLAQKLIEKGKNPSDLFNMTSSDMTRELDLEDDFSRRISRLLERNASLSFELESLTNIGIGVVTRADSNYPSALKRKLSGGCPPLFYYAGNLNLVNSPTIGYVGSRSVDQRDIDFAQKSVNTTVSKGFGVVSGGAKGIDSISGASSLSEGSFSIEYLADSMQRKLKNSDTVKNIQDGKLLLLSVAKPDAGFNVGMAMMRNRYIYAQSEATVVVRSDLNKGGTWAGATDTIKHGWCPVLCWNHPYPGNRALIEMGAAAIDYSWNGNIPEVKNNCAPDYMPEQMTLFG